MGDHVVNVVLASAAKCSLSSYRSGAVLLLSCAVSAFLFNRTSLGVEHRHL